MQIPRRFDTIRFRLSAAVSTMTFASVVLLAALFVWKDFDKTVQGERERLTSIASAYAAASADGAAARDRQVLLETLRGIGSLSDIVYAGVFGPDGVAIAQIGASVALAGREGVLADQSRSGLFSVNVLTVSMPVLSGGRQVGTLELQADIKGIRAAYLRGLAELVGFGLLVLALSAIATNWLVARMTRPLSEMTGRLVAMGDHPDLSLRFVRDRADEVGVFAAALNSAFDRIEARDRAIRRHRDTLEETVAMRTLELREAVSAAERANAAKSDFLATMSHEIRTPMNGMLVMAELLAASPLAARQRRQARIITRTGHVLLHIINDILDMSKIEAGKIELEHVPFSVDMLLAGVAELFSAHAHEKGLSLAVDVARPVAAGFLGDPVRLGQVVGNLVNNALKFTEAGGVTIRVRTLDGAANGSQKLRIEVEDTGMGIAQDKLATIFEAFSQADQSITRTHGGTGLGLSISRRLVTAMSGDISVDSAPGRGSVFAVELELDVDRDAIMPAVPDVSGRVVRLLDSEPVTRAALAAGLAGYGVTLAGETGPCDMIVGTSEAIAARARGDGWPDAEVPVVSLRPYGLDGGDAGAFGPVRAELSLPLSRMDIAGLLTALATGDFAALGKSPADDAWALPEVRFDGFSVLAVDDDAVNREVLNEALTAVGVNAVFVSSGEKAVEAFRGQPFDVVFMDCSMPGMDGYQATKALRSIEREEGRRPARIVALTAHVGGAQAELWRRSDMNGHVVKPFTIEQLCREMSLARPRDGGQDASAPAGEPVSAQHGTETLLAASTLEMFETVSQINRVDMKAKVFSLFIENAPDALVNVIDAAGRSQSSEDVARSLHALKSMCSSAGAALGAAQCGRLEEQAKQGAMPSARDIIALGGIIDRTIAAMSASLAAPTAQTQGMRRVG